MSDINCPYCHHPHDANSENNEQETLYEVECEECDKIFGYSFTLYKIYKERELPCANGKKHKWEKIIGAPKEFYENKYRCSFCEKEKEFKI